MSAVAYIQANLVPALALAILLVNARRHLPYSRTNRLFQLIAALAIIELAIDAAVALVAGGSFSGDVAWAWVLNVSFYLLGGMLSLCWFLYVRGMLLEQEGLAPRGWAGALAAAPFAAYGLITVSSPWTHLLFSVNEDAAYVRGPLFAAIFAISFGYLLAASALALVRRRRMNDADIRRRCLYLAAFSLPTFIAGVLQVLFGSQSFLVPGLAVSILLVYLDLQRGRITQDALTGLYNRGRLDVHLQARCARARGGSPRPWCLVIIDVDDFKAINDSRGHVGGDAALRFVAGALKRVFGRQGAFIARYGGDEFAVALDAPGEDAVKDLLRAFDALLATGPGAKGAPGIPASAGYAFARLEDAEDPGRLVRRADAAMYARKQRRKAVAGPRA